MTPSPSIEADQARLATVDSIASEHSDDRDPNAERLMGRFYLRHNWFWSDW
jgi:hypothetical protein